MLYQVNSASQPSIFRRKVAILRVSASAAGISTAAAKRRHVEPITSPFRRNHRHVNAATHDRETLFQETRRDGRRHSPPGGRSPGPRLSFEEGLGLRRPSMEQASETKR